MDTPWKSMNINYYYR